MDQDPKAFLLFGLEHFGIKLLSDDGKHLHLEKGYQIELEAAGLFKLLQHDQVIAPFNDVEELCHFIKQDIELNEEN